MPDIVNFSGADSLFEQCEDCPRNLLDSAWVIDKIIALQLLPDVFQELLFVAYMQRLVCWIPPLVIEAADEHWELRS